MIGLLDVNALVALFDPEHVHHSAVHEWFGEHRKLGWATCPLTENGIVRIVANPKYPGRRTTVADAIDRLTRFRESDDHSFWTDSLSLCDPELLNLHHVQGHRQLTDVYLLALAVEHGGRLVTFDRSVRLEAVPSASSRNLKLLGAPDQEVEE